MSKEPIHAVLPVPVEDDLGLQLRQDHPEAVQTAPASFWAVVQPEVQRLAPAAAHGAGRALFDSWAFDD